MATTKKAAKPKAQEDPLRAPGRLQKVVNEWAFGKKQAEGLSKAANQLRDQLSAYVQRYGHKDAKGSFWVELDQVVQAPGGKPFNAIKWERSSGETADEDVAWEIAEGKGITEEVFDWIPVLNEEKLDEAFKSGLITWEERQEIMKAWESFRFVASMVE